MFHAIELPIGVGEGIGSPLAAFLLKLNLCVTMAQTKSGRATTKARMSPIPRSLLVGSGNDLNLANSFTSLC